MRVRTDETVTMDDLAKTIWARIYERGGARCLGCGVWHEAVGPDKPSSLVGGIAFNEAWETPGGYVACLSCAQDPESLDGIESKLNGIMADTYEDDFARRIASCVAAYFV